MRKHFYISILLLVVVLLSLGGCARLTMPKANQALGQLRIGNEQEAWEMIESELQDPGVSSQVELCELNGIAVQILQQVILKDYLPQNREEIGKKSYDYVIENCQDFIWIVGLTEHNYGQMLMTLGKPGLALEHSKKSLQYVEEGSFGYIIKEDTLSDIYTSLGKFELRDYHRKNALKSAKIYFNSPRSYRWNTDEFHEWGGYVKILSSRMNDLSWAENAKSNLPEMHSLWTILEQINARWYSKGTQYLIYTRASQLFAEAGDISFAWELYYKAKKLVNTYSSKNRDQDIASLKLTEAQILKNEGEYKRAATLMQEWINNFHASYGRAPGANAYRIAGLTQEYARNYDEAIIYLEKSIENTEVLRASFDIEMRDSLMGGLVATSYWGLIRSYTKRYLQKGMEEDFNGAIRSARMLRGRQFGELLGIDYHAGDNLNLDSLQLNSDELLLDFILTDRAIIALAISSKEHKLFEVPYDNYAFNSAIKKVKDALSQPGNFDDSIDELLYISETVLRPVKNMLSNSQRLIVIPDGSLNGVPFNLLSSSSVNYSPLIMDYETVLSPSLSYFVQQRSNHYHENADNIFTLADPVYGKREAPEIYRDKTEIFYTRAVEDFGLFIPLPETRTEVEKITKQFNSSDVTSVFGNKASETTVKSTDLAHYRYLHFATHGILGNQIPGIDEPALVLAAEPPSSHEDGFLTMREVQQLKLNSDLTVLSACDTGSGKYFSGEGVMGLSRGFLLAGSQSVLVSLWPVSSQATVKLMEQFYKNLKSGKSKSESLRLAQLSMMNNSQLQNTDTRGLIRITSKSNISTKSVHPFYWAPFVLIGE